MRHAFGSSLKPPVAVWRSAEAAGSMAAVPHCLFAALPEIEAGGAVSFTLSNLHCGGGRLYCGFAPRNPGVARFVSERERYKQTPAMVDEYIDSLGIRPAEQPCLNMARIDRIGSFDGIDGVFFLAEPDALSGLCAWAFFDNNSPDAVACLFGSGCSSLITNIVGENERRGRRTFRPAHTWPPANSALPYPCTASPRWPARCASAACGMRPHGRACVSGRCDRSARLHLQAPPAWACLGRSLAKPAVVLLVNMLENSLLRIAMPPVLALETAPAAVWKRPF